MVKKSLRKNTIREIKNSFGRFFAILAIACLGVGFFSGLQVTKDAMVQTGDEYFREKHLFDFRLISTLGLIDEDVTEFKKLSYVTDAEGQYSTDAIVKKEDGSMSVAKIHSIPERINGITVLEGRLPVNDNECVVDSRWPDAGSIGMKITISDTNETNVQDMFNTKEFTIVGTVKSVYYINFERGNTALGNGKIAGFIYVNPEAFTTDYYTEIFLTTDASKEEIYSDAYNDEIDGQSDEIEFVLDELANARYDSLYEQAMAYFMYTGEMPDGLKEPDTYVLARTTNIGYACFENDSAIVEGIGNVFPVFFFLVAALVCMTTMNRMVEEQRTEIGVFKALGYSDASIIWKYLSYAGSAAVIGCVAGFFIGSKLFPWVIWNAYQIMYTAKDIVFIVDRKLAIISIIVSLLCSVGATYVTLRSELRSDAASLMRPKAPKNGKRVFAERIKFIWNRLSFMAKVSIRNTFRYKKRFFMMILGVGGCYGLLITGFGIKDSIADVADCQFNEIQTYDLTVVFSDEVNDSDKKEFEKLITGDDSYLYVESLSVDVFNDNKTKSATLMVLSDTQKAQDFIRFTDEKLVPLESLKEGDVILTAKMARLLERTCGDEVLLRDTELNEIHGKVSGVMKNYVYNYVFINPSTYKDYYGKEPIYNCALVKTTKDPYELSVSISKLSSIASVSVIDEMRTRVDSMMQSLDMVVYVVIGCAAALAFIVMYNLTNINIQERIREIATLKVLGFYPMETSVYVFRENLVLTLIGCVAGVFMGYALHRYVMYNINVEVVTFDTKILAQSYLFAVLLTVLFALLVDFFLHFKLEKIKMVESLKSIE